MSIAINNVPTREQYSASAAQTVFNVPFPFYSQTYLRVYQRAPADEPNNTTQLLTLGDDYSVTGEGLESGGYITLTVGAPLNDIITIVEDQPVDRPSVFDDLNQFTVSLNQQLNELTVMTQQSNTVLNQLTPKYRVDELVSDDVRQHNLELPILNDGYIWIGRGNFGDDPDDIQAVKLSSIVPGAGGTSGGTTKIVTQVDHGYAVWDALYRDTGQWLPADASNDTTGESIGLVVEVVDDDTFILQSSGPVSSPIVASWGPFIDTRVYFLSETTPGQLTLTPPTGFGEVEKPCFVADGDQSGWIMPYRGEIIGAETGGGGGAGTAPSDATYITQTPETGLDNEQALSLLDTGLMKNTTGTGVVSIATNGTDYYGPGTPTPVTVGEGGTGNTTFTPYSVIVGGTTATGAFQNVSGVGTAGQVLTSAGAGNIPVWQAPGGAGSGSIIQSQSLNYSTSFFREIGDGYGPVPGFAVTITPTSATSKILVRVVCTCGNDGINRGTKQCAVKRNGTYLKDPAASYFAVAQCDGAFGGSRSSMTFEFTDEPASTDPLEYQVWFAGLYLNYHDVFETQSALSHITVSELSA